MESVRYLGKSVNLKFLKNSILLCTTILLVCSNIAAAQDWTRYTYKTGQVKGIHLSNEDPEDLLVLGTWSYIDESLYYSQDGGENLSLDDQYSSVKMSGLHTCFARPDSFYALCRRDDERFLLISPDNGETFEERSIEGYEFINPRMINSLCNPNRLCVYTSDGYIVSDDAGMSWNLLVNFPRRAGLFAFHPQNDSIYYGFCYESMDDGLFKSEDCGQTWVRYDSLYSPEFYIAEELTIDVLDPDIMYAKAYTYAPRQDQYLGLAKSVDGGVHWELINEPLEIVGYNYDGAFLFVEGNNLYVSYDGGETLIPRLVEEAVLPLDGYEPFAAPAIIKTQADNPLKLWVYRCDILFRTVNGGLSWQMIGEGYNQRKYKKIQKNPHNQNQLLLFGSYGNAWTINRDGSNPSLLSMANIDGYQISAVDPNTILRFSTGKLTEQSRLEMTTNNGDTWISLDQNIPVEDTNSGLLSAAMIGSNPDILFVEMGQFYGYDYIETNLYRSDDRGLSWVVIDEVDNTAWFTPDTYNPDRMYITCDRNVCRWDSNDGSYSMVHPQMEYIREIHPLTGDVRGSTDSESIIVSEEGELLSTLTYPTETGLNNLRFHPSVPGGIVATTSTGNVFFTEDLGVNWIELDGPVSEDIQWRKGLEVDTEGNLFIIDASFGLWVGEEVILGIDEDLEPITPVTYELLSPFPNPFNSTIQIPFNISRLGLVSFTVYDMLGREVDRIVRTVETAGKQTISWNTTGKNIASGTYILRMEAEDFVSSKKIQLVK